jgi:hypothetical protein
VEIGGDDRIRRLAQDRCERSPGEGFLLAGDRLLPIQAGVVQRLRREPSENAEDLQIVPRGGAIWLAAVIDAEGADPPVPDDQRTVDPGDAMEIHVGQPRLAADLSESFADQLLRPDRGPVRLEDRRDDREGMERNRIGPVEKSRRHPVGRPAGQNPLRLIEEIEPGALVTELMGARHDPLRQLVEIERLLQAVGDAGESFKALSQVFRTADRIDRRDRVQQLAFVDRLVQEEERSRLEDLDLGVLGNVLAGEDDHAHARMPLLDRSGHRGSAHLRRQHLIAEDDVDGLAVHDAQGLRAVRRGEHPVEPGLQGDERTQGLADVLLVVHDQDAGRKTFRDFHDSTSRGSSIKKVEPEKRKLSPRRSDPPICSTKARDT